MKTDFPEKNPVTPMNQFYPFSLLDPFGPASFVILDTDYNNYALVCTCQAKKFLFEVLTFHRRSCTILQRSSERDGAISRKVIFDKKCK